MIVLNIGKCAYAMALPMKQFLVEGNKYNVEEKIEGSTGSGCNTAYLLAKWRVDSTFCGMIAYDDYGTKIKKELEAIGVDTSGIEIAYEKETPMEFAVLNEGVHSKTEVLVQKEPFFLKKNEFNKIPDIILTDGYEYSASIQAINKFKNAKSILGVSEFTKEAVEIAKYANFVIFSLSFAENLTKLKADFNNPTTLLNIYKKIKEKYSNNEIIVNLGPFGVMYTLNQDVKVMPPIQINVLDGRGAKDVFNGAFAYCISKNYDMEKSIRFSSIASSISMTKFGIKDAFPALMEVIQNYESRFGSIDEPNGNEAVLEGQNQQQVDSTSVPNQNGNNEMNQSPITPVQQTVQDGGIIAPQVDQVTPKEGTVVNDMPIGNQTTSMPNKEALSYPDHHELNPTMSMNPSDSSTDL